jgi:ribonuclease HI
MHVLAAKECVISLRLHVMIEKRETLRGDRVNTIAICRDSQTAMPGVTHLQPGKGQRLARPLPQGAQALVTNSIATEIQWVQGHSVITGNEEADREAHRA